MTTKLLREFDRGRRTVSIQGPPLVDLNGCLLARDEAAPSDVSFLEVDDDEIESLLPIWHLSRA